MVVPVGPLDGGGHGVLARVPRLTTRGVVHRGCGPGGAASVAAVGCRVRDALLDLLLDRSCLGCGDLTGLVCPACAALLRSAPTPSTPTVPGAPVTWAVAGYEGPVRALVLASKERGQAAVRRRLAGALAASVAGALAVSCASGLVVLLPVPSTRATVRARGDDVVHDLAVRAARDLRRRGREVVVRRGLVPHGRRRDQVGLGERERQDNVAGTVVLRPGWSPPPRAVGLVLVDDVVTSGATLAESSRAARGCGLPVLAAAVVAATPRRTSRARR